MASTSMNCAAASVCRESSTRSIRSEVGNLIIPGSRRVRAKAFSTEVGKRVEFQSAAGRRLSKCLHSRLWGSNRHSTSNPLWG